MKGADLPVPKLSSRPTAPTRPLDEIAHMGDEIYERDIKSQVEAANHGQIVAIDVDSGSWAIAGSELAAAERLRSQRSDAANVWLLRVGYRAIASIGGGSLQPVRMLALRRGSPSPPHRPICLTRQPLTDHGGRTRHVPPVHSGQRQLPYAIGPNKDIHPDV